ncbi:hypothetical protein PG990_009971 [Apiospora arundinis]
MSTIRPEGLNPAHVFNFTEDITTLNKCLPQLFASAVLRYLRRTAVICGDTQLTYEELSSLVDHFTHVLLQQRIGRGHLIAIALPRSAQLVALFLAVLKTGAAYVPIDPTFPLQRISHMLNNAAPEIVIVTTETQHVVSLWHGGSLNLDVARRQISSTTLASSPPISPDLHPEDLAYVIYTSGSTGQPKGVRVSHGALCNMLLSLKQEPGCDESDRLLAVSPVTFDMAVPDLYLPLLSGATAVFAHTHQTRDPTELIRLMERHQITMMQGTPTIWQMLLDSGWRGIPRLVRIICGGEALPRRLAQRLLDCGDSVWNGYGPTETTVYTTFWRVIPDTDPVIGSPIKNVQVYVLDKDLSPVPAGSPGELYIGGAGVSKGYHNNDDLTRSKFIANEIHGGLLYQTGDLACFVAPGTLNILGRADGQVKIRGHRVEVGDIEAAIMDHDEISSAVVSYGKGQLIAYCVRGGETYAPVDLDSSRGVAEWAAVLSHAYTAEGDSTVFNIAGWQNSYNNQPFSPQEMRDWQAHSVHRLLSYSPERVFEIGSGTGLLLFPLAPHCRAFHAIDASAKAVELTRKLIASMPHVTCDKAEAHMLPELLHPSYDTVIINSVAQYFPSLKYFLSVIEWAVRAVAGKGRVYLGDLRNLTLLETFHADVIASRADRPVPAAELAERAEHAARLEKELVVSPELFANLPTLLPRIKRVDVTFRNGRYANEMSRYRFDVTLHVGEGDDGDDAVVDAEQYDWQEEDRKFETLRSKLALLENNALRINNVPNGRLREAHDACMPTDDTKSSRSWVEVGTFMDFAEEFGLELALLPSRSGDLWSLDAVFWPSTLVPDLSLHEVRRINQGELTKYANVPIIGEPAKVSLGRLLRPWLADRLPDYMMPAFFVELDRMPVTSSGKIDHRSLPHPTEHILENITPPSTKMEHVIVGVWSDILGHDRFGIKENFFQIGGDSVRIVRVQAALQKLLGHPVSTAKLFEHHTIQTLAAYLDSTRPNGKEATKILPSSQWHVDSPAASQPPKTSGSCLKKGCDVIQDVPKDRWEADALYDPDPMVPGTSYCRRGGFLDSIDSFDASFFGITPHEARTLDPQQRLMLETSWEALERAGYTLEVLRGSPTGVFIGVSTTAANAGSAAADGDPVSLNGYVSTGLAGGTMSGRVAYSFGLEGPAMTVDTACSASLVATHLACAALRRGECDLALAGGVALLLTPALHIEFSRLRGLSSDGRCRAFAEDASGLGLGEGAAAVVLKRLSDARRDGDFVHAVIRASAVNHGGRGPSLTTPSGPAQRRLIRTALAQAALQPDQIDYVEAHGTATKLGDPIEGVALGEVFGGGSRPATAEPLWVGSAKSNIGHTQAAAGLVGLIKVVLALENCTMPQTLHAGQPTSAIDWQAAKMALVNENRPWPIRHDRCRRAGVSAFGIGGTNAHLIVEEAPDRELATGDTQMTPISPPVVPLMLSGRTDAALAEQALRLHTYLCGPGRDLSLRDVGFSLATTRNHFEKRMVLLAKGKAELENLTKTMPSPSIRRGDAGSGEPHLAMLFTGQGSQWPGMGKGLASSYPVFRQTVSEIASQFENFLELPLLDVMWAHENSETAGMLRTTEYSQPALFALQISLWRLWESWGVRANAVLGHSIGELAAAHVAGVMSLSDACRLVAARGRLMQSIGTEGKMVSLEASAVELDAAIDELGVREKVDVASHNTPSQTVLSGDVDAVDGLTTHFTSKGRRSRALEVSHAFHSHHMNGILPDLRAVAETIQFSPPTLPIVSGSTGQLAEAGQLESPEYWVQQVRNPVHFSRGIQVLFGRGHDIFLEVGPRTVLCGLGAACVTDNKQSSAARCWLPSLLPAKRDVDVILSSLTELHLRRVSVDWASYFEPARCTRVELPTYAFQRESFELWGQPKLGDSSNNNSRRCITSGPRDGGIDQAARQFAFDVKWVPLQAKRISCSGSWGILCPGGVVPWAQDVAMAFTSAGMNWRAVSTLREAQEMDGLLSLWAPSVNNNVLERARDLTATALEQLQEAVECNFPRTIVWVTRNVVGTGTGPDEQINGLGASPLWGLMRVACNEHPELQLQMVDLGEEDVDIQSLPPSLPTIKEEPECAIRHGRVLVPRIERVDSWLPQHQKRAAHWKPFRRDGAVLVTGGTGGIGQRVAKWLVEDQGVPEVVLVSRRGMAAPGAEALATTLSQLGATATIVTGDIADEKDVRRILSQFHHGRPLRGVVHTAAVIDDGILSTLTPPRCDAVFAPKVDGAWHLHHLTQEMNMDLDYFVLFSSISGTMGTAGQGNYAAANTFLDSLAYLRRAQGLPAVSVAWGSWVGEGMAAQLSKTSLARYAQFGLDPLTSEHGLELLKRAMYGRDQLLVAAGFDLERLQRYYESRRGIPLFFQSLLSQRSGPGPRPYLDLNSGNQDWDLHKALAEAGPGDGAAKVMLDLVQAAVAQTLGFTSPDQVDVGIPLQQIGVDSLTAVLTRNQLANLTNLSLPASIVFDHPNLTSLSRFLLAKVMDNAVDSSKESESGIATPASSTTTVSEDYRDAVKKGCLDPSITFENAAPQSGQPPQSPSAAFVTGGTGFVGAHLVHDLLARGVAVHGLVRAPDVEHGARRLAAALADYDLWRPQYVPLLHAVLGDMAQTRFGLTEAAFDALADRVDMVCHAGALVDWMRPLRDYVGPNIVSTHEALRLASRGAGPKTFHHVSTVATLPMHAGYDVGPADREYGYATSKYLAERMVAAARWRGARAVVYRLPFVTAAMGTGHFRRDRGDFLHNLIAGCLEMGPCCFPSLDGADMSAVLPVDYLSGVIATMATQDLSRIGYDLDFLYAQAPSFDDFARALTRAVGGPSQAPVAFKRWRQQALDYAMSHPSSPLARIAAVLDHLNDKEAREMFKRPQVGDNVLGGKVTLSRWLTRKF